MSLLESQSLRRPPDWRPTFRGFGGQRPPPLGNHVFYDWAGGYRWAALGDPGRPWGHPGDSKWPSKGPAREPKEVLEPWEKAGRKSDDFGSPGGGHTLAGGERRSPGFQTLWHPWEGFPPARERSWHELDGATPLEIGKQIYLFQKLRRVFVHGVI